MLYAVQQNHAYLEKLKTDTLNDGVNVTPKSQSGYNVGLNFFLLPLLKIRHIILVWANPQHKSAKLDNFVEVDN